jgi:hypothetical protein
VERAKKAFETRRFFGMVVTARIPERDHPGKIVLTFRGGFANRDEKRALLVYNSK